jgi:hypothetical protein
MEVYGEPFCEVHGAEAKAGALAKRYDDACQFLERFGARLVPAINPEALRVIRAGVSELPAVSWEAVGDGDAALRRAYPFRQDLVDEDWQAYFEDEDWDQGPTPEDWCRRHRMFLHKSMRLAYAECATYIVDGLERLWEHSAVQLSYVLAEAERKRAEPEVGKS